MGLCRCQGMSGVKLVYGALMSAYAPWYAMSGTEQWYGALLAAFVRGTRHAVLSQFMMLRAWDAMSDTERGYDAARCRRSAGTTS
eukprot:3223904-Rhodomonas_salina.4